MSRFRQLMIANRGSKYPANATVWEVTIPEGGAEYSFQVESGLGWNNTWNGQPFMVDWGDGSVEDVGSAATVARITPIHTYTTAGVYTVSATGQQESIKLARQSATYGKFVSKFIQASNTLTIYSDLLNPCSSITELPSNLTIPAIVTKVISMLQGTNITALPPRMLLHEGITDANNFLGSSSIQYLPEGFTIPDSTAASCSRIITRCSKLKRLPESFRIPQAATVLDQFFLNDSSLEYVPKECRIPPNVVNLSYFAGSAFKAGAADIAELLAIWNPQSSDINLKQAFEASNINGIAPADKLWNNPLSATWNVENCFLRAFNVENLGEIPATWGGGKIALENTTITLSDSTVDFVLLKESVNIARFYNLYGVKVELTGLPDGLRGAWSGYDYKITGTLPAGTYTFTVHAYNKYDTTGATATITLIVGGSGGGLKVSGVMATMAAMITPAFSFADGDYSLLDASASGHNRVWKLENGGTAFYFRWSETKQAWTLAETEEDPAMVNFPYIYSTVHGDDPWTSSGWEFSLTGPVDISVTQA